MAEIISKILKVRVAKCQYFYTEQIFQTKFYPRKNAWIAASLVPKRNKFDIKGFLRRASAENFIIYGWFYDRNLYKFPNFTHTTIQYSKTACSTTLFTPTFQYFYTDTYALSVTFLNSASPLSSNCHWSQG